MSKRTVMFVGVVLVTYGGAIWVSYHYDQNFRLLTWLTAAKVCQRAARTIGACGIHAENHYHTLVEAGRTI